MLDGSRFGQAKSVSHNLYQHSDLMMNYICAFDVVKKKHIACLRTCLPSSHMFCHFNWPVLGFLVKHNWRTLIGGRSTWRCATSYPLATKMENSRFSCDFPSYNFQISTYGHLPAPLVGIGGGGSWAELWTIHQLPHFGTLALRKRGEVLPWTLPPDMGYMGPWLWTSQLYMG